MIAHPLYRPDSEELRFLPEGPHQLQLAPGGNPTVGWVSIQHAVDLKTGSFNLLDLVTLRNERHDLPGRPGFFAETDQPGVIVVGLERRLVLYDYVHRAVTETGIIVSDDERVIINDGLAIPGGLIFGTKHLKFDQRIAAAYYFDSATLRLTTLIPGQICSNGKYFYHQNGQTLLADIDSPNKTVDLHHLDLATSTVLESKILADFRALRAVPDGMRITPDGRSLVVAFYDPGKADFGTVRQVSLATGEPEAEWHLPGSPRVTCPEFIQFGGQIKLLLTTATEGMPREERENAPEAGTLFIADTDWDRLPPFPPLVGCASTRAADVHVRPT